MKRENNANRDAEGEQRRPQHTVAEWTAFAVAALIILGVAGVLAGHWLLGPSSPPTFRMEPQPVQTINGTHHVGVDVENIGAEAAAGVQVSAELRTGAQIVRADETIDFLAPGETTSVTFIFRSDPRIGDLSITVSAFRNP